MRTRRLIDPETGRVLRRFLTQTDDGVGVFFGRRFRTTLATDSGAAVVRHFRRHPQELPARVFATPANVTRHDNGMPIAVTGFRLVSAP